ncbi:MAG: hypothetical protein HXX15_12765 [Rhodopseudomonas sp.]|uniref:hypothetical protein n=1 Tax=Rhodopseudomonas sp. TaxID=1078 RepID=UPI00182058B7|nr:hypothetical protein [Rhodopseudomonas sp.]NVN86945.1 hypothetical protein [Rhodopseudomonas sp.]
MLAAALSAAVLWLQLIPSWLAFASLGVTLAAAGMMSDVRYGRIRLKRGNAGTGKLRLDTNPADRWTAFARVSEPFAKRRTLRQLARASQGSEAIHQKRLRAEALFYDLVQKTPAAEMLTSPALGRQRDLIATLSIRDSVAKAELEARADSIRTEVLGQLRNGTAIAQGKSHPGDERAIIQPAQWLDLELDGAMQNALGAVDGKVVYSELKITRQN